MALFSSRRANVEREWRMPGISGRGSRAEALVVRRVRDRHLDEIVVVSGHEVRLDHLWDLRQGVSDLPEDVLVVPVERYLDEDDIRNSDGLAVEDSNIAIDGTAGFQALHACPAG